MGKIRVLRESDLRSINNTGGREKVYPVTSADAVYFPGVDNGKLSDNVRPRKVLSESEFDRITSLDPKYDYYVYEDE